MNWLVIPEGISLNAEKKPELSCLFRHVLDELLVVARPEDKIVICPANNFGTARFEHELAYEYLRSKNPILAVLVTNDRPVTYADTRMNAILLKRWLANQKLELEGPCALWVYWKHSWRAQIAFKQEGFILAKTHRVYGRPKSNCNIVSRLFYYHHPLLHILYEALATTLTYGRII